MYMDYSRIFYQYIFFKNIHECLKWTWILLKEIYLINHEYYERNLQVKTYLNIAESDIPENSNLHRCVGIKRINFWLEIIIVTLIKKILLK
jgi:hypothetical protein